jgi:hypothetical protein
MKTGRSLSELAREIERQGKTKKDYYAASPAIVMHGLPGGERAGAGEVELELGSMGRRLGVTELAHEQIAGRLGIPRQYYDRMLREAPGLLAENANHWFRARADERQLVRTLDGNVRALLSDRYRPLDHLDLAQAVLPILGEAGVRVESCEVTERRLYLKAVTDRVTAEVKRGDVVQAGIVVTNSEVGLGAVKVEPMVYRLVCLNGAIVPDAGLRRQHVGRAGAEFDLDGAAEFYRDATRRADDRAFWMKVRDVVRGALKAEGFARVVDRYRAAAKLEIKRDPVAAVQEVGRRFGLTEGESGGVLRHLIAGGDLSAYGVMNAVTRESQDVASYDRATELERVGGQVIELPRTEWARIAEEN